MDLETKKDKDMAIPAMASNPGKFSVIGVVDFLKHELSVSETLLAGLLDVTSRTLDNWKKLTYPDELTGKAKRIQALYDFVQLAKTSGVKSSEMLSLVTEAIDANDEASKSPLYYINEEADINLFMEFSKLAIKNFLK